MGGKCPIGYLLSNFPPFERRKEEICQRNYLLGNYSMGGCTSFLPLAFLNVSGSVLVILVVQFEAFSSGQGSSQSGAVERGIEAGGCRWRVQRRG